MNNLQLVEKLINDSKLRLKNKEEPKCSKYYFHEIDICSGKCCHCGLSVGEIIFNELKKRLKKC